MSSIEPPWNLSIDKLSVIHNETVLDRVGIVCTRLVDMVSAGHFPGSILTGHRRFEVQLNLPIPGSTGRFVIQAGPKIPNQCHYRVEFNPAKVGPYGTAYIIELLDNIFPQGGHDLLRDGYITRVDVALDLLGLSADNVIARSRQQQAHGVFSNRYGIPANIYFGKKKNNNTSIYTKETKDQPAFLRVERRLVTRIPGRELATMANPFGVIQLVHTDVLKPFATDLNPYHLFDSMRVRGVTHVLKELPVRQQRDMEAALKSPDHSLLPSLDKVWETWPATVIEHGLGFLVGPVTPGKSTSLPSDGSHVQ